MKNILIIKLGSLGDVLRTTCILSGLQKKYPNARIMWVTSSDAVCLINGNPFVHYVVDIEQFRIRHLHDARFDLVINLEDDYLACSIATQVHTKQLFGAYISDGDRKYTIDSGKWFDMSLISCFGKEEANRRKKNNRRTYPSLLFEMLDISIGKPLIHIPEPDIAFARRFAHTHIAKQKPVVGLNTGAGSRWRYKQLGENKTTDLVGKILSACDCEILLFGGTGEVSRNQSILARSPHRIIDAGNNNSLTAFAALINLCNLLVTSDSLALHVASALEIPTIVFFGPTSASEIELFSQGKKIVPDMDCICCYKKDCDFIPTCMDNIPLGSIVDETIRILNFDTGKV